jgi:hypothetical protein
MNLEHHYPLDDARATPELAATGHARGKVIIRASR